MSLMNIQTLLDCYYSETGNQGLWNTGLYTTEFVEWIIKRLNTQDRYQIALDTIAEWEESLKPKQPKGINPLAVYCRRQQTARSI
jgi:hypothetical protein